MVLSIWNAKIVRDKGLLNKAPERLGFMTPTEVFIGKSFEENFALQSATRHLQ